jgi:transposase
VAFAVPRVECQACGLVRQVDISFADPRRSYTRSFERYVLELSWRMTFRDVARHLNVGWDLIKDIQKRDLLRRYAKPKLKHLRYIAIDEIAVAKGHQYLTVVMDLESGAVVFVGDGKGADALMPFWKRLRPSKAKIEAVATDMSAAYWGAVMTYLPKAKIVFDHFHVIKLFNDKLSDLRRDLPRGYRRDEEECAQRDAVVVAEEPREPRHREERKAAAGGSTDAEQAIGNSLLLVGRPATVLGPTREGVRDDVPGRLDSLGRGVRDQGAPADDQGQRA